MKTKNIAILAALSLGFTASALAADGTINFSGEIITDGCTVATSLASGNILSLDKIATSAFRVAGDTAASKSFDIILTNCPLNSVAVRFDGTADNTNSNLLQIATGTGAATNLGIGLYESDSRTAIPVGGLSASKTLSSGAATFTFNAKYVSTGVVTAGTVTASTQFTIAYQ